METIILLHGALGSERDLGPLAQLLSSDQLDVRRLNFSGHGQNSFNEEFSIKMFAKELELFILQNNLTGCSIFGYSMGGFVALTLAAERPELIKRIITLGTKFNWTFDAIEKEAGNCDEKKMEEKVPAFAASLKKTHKDFSGLLSSTAKLIRDFEGHPFPDRKVLSKIKIPVMIGRGDRDKLVTLEETVAVQKELSNASLYIIPGGGHSMTSVSMELLVANILYFINLKSVFKVI